MNNCVRFFLLSVIIAAVICACTDNNGSSPGMGRPYAAEAAFAANDGSVLPGAASSPVRREVAIFSMETHTYEQAEPDAAESPIDAAAASAYAASAAAATSAAPDATAGDKPASAAPAAVGADSAAPDASATSADADAPATTSADADAPATADASAADAATPAPLPARQAVAIPVLNYHSIADDDPDNVAVLPTKRLEEQLAFLARESFTPLTLADFIAVLEGRKEAPAKPVLLTFDDGYADNYTNAMPLLRKYGFPATLFMSPGSVGDPYYIDWKQAQEMRDAGWDIQPHGMTHPHLPRLGADEQEHEIAEAKRLIEEQLGTTADVFCYPYGERNATTLKLLAEHGFRYAFTIDQGVADDSQPKLTLKRIFVNGQESLRVFARKLGH